MFVFDLDGTLYKTYETCITVLEEFCGEYRLKIVPEDVRYLMYTTVAALVERIAPHLSATDRSRFEQEFKRREAETILQSGELFKGAEDLLRRLKKAGHALAICGMGSEEHVDAVLKRCNILRYFDYVYSNRQGKTKTELLEELICHAGRQKEDCVMIGDSITDLIAAKDNRVPFIGVRYGYGTEGIKGSLMAEDIEELEGLLNQYALFPPVYKEIVRFKHPPVIGVDGADTAGKTTFADHFARYLEGLGHPALVIHADDFHNPRQIRMRDPSPEGYLHNAFDTKKLARLLLSFREGQADQTLELLDLDTNKLNNKKRFIVNSNTIIIVEGVLLYRPPLDTLVDYKIFLEIDAGEVLRRAKMRDIPRHGEDFLEKYKNRYIPAHKIYLDEYFPKTRCDMLIDNTDYNHPVILSAEN